MWQFALVFLLAAHGLIHLLYVGPAPDDPKYPFVLIKSWLITRVGLSASSVRALGVVLAILTALSFVLSALAAAGIIIPQDWWQPLTVASAGFSLALLALFWHRRLVLGIIIDVALIVAVLWLRWEPFTVTGA